MSAARPVSRPAMSRNGPVVGAIWAQNPQGVIGKDGTIPWHVPEDLRFFSNTTTGHPVIMGRRTWESFPPRFRPLPGRPNIVVTSRPETVASESDNVWAAASYAQALELALSLLDDPNGEIWAIGGTRIWADALAHEALPLTRAYVTTVDLTVEGDTVAPRLDDTWRQRELADWAKSSKGPRFRMDEYTRR